MEPGEFHLHHLTNHTTWDKLLSVSELWYLHYNKSLHEMLYIKHSAQDILGVQ